MDEVCRAEGQCEQVATHTAQSACAAADDHHCQHDRLRGEHLGDQRFKPAAVRFLHGCIRMFGIHASYRTYAADLYEIHHDPMDTASRCAWSFWPKIYRECASFGAEACKLELNACAAT
eukprot:3499134-Pleurochrysis_carterae.AAC.1